MECGFLNSRFQIFNKPQVDEGLMIAISNKNLKIPEQIAVSSFSDEPICNMFNPPLTAIRPMGYELGMETAQLLIDRIESSELYYEPVGKSL